MSIHDNTIKTPLYLNELSILENIVNEFSYIYYEYDDDDDDDDDDDNNGDEYEEDEAINRFFNENTIIKKVFDFEKCTELLRHYCYEKNNHNNSSCPIYLVDFKEGDEIVELPCGHCFIPEAIYNWLETQSNSCPYCRYEMPYKEIKIKCPYNQVIDDSELFNRPLNIFQYAIRHDNDNLLEILCELINKNNF